MNNNMVKGTVCAVISALIFGITPVLSSLSFQMGSNPVTLTFYRNLMAVPFFLAILLYSHEDLGITKKEFAELFVIGVVFRCSTNLCLCSSYKYIGVGLATTLHFIYPVFTVMVGLLFFGKKFDRARFVALAIAMIGLIFAMSDSSASGMKGVILALVSAVTYTGYLVGMEQLSIKDMNPMKVMMYLSVFNAGFLAITDIPRGEIVYRLPYNALGISLLVAIFSSAIAYVLLMKGIKYIGAGNVAIYGTLEPVVGVLSGLIIFKEAMVLETGVGCALILAAVMIPIISDMNVSRRRIHKEYAVN